MFPKNLSHKKKKKKKLVLKRNYRKVFLQYSFCSKFELSVNSIVNYFKYPKVRFFYIFWKMRSPNIISYNLSKSMCFLFIKKHGTDDLKSSPRELVKRIDALLKRDSVSIWIRTRCLPVTRPLFYYWAIAPWP